MNIHLLRKKESDGLAQLLASYWKTRNMPYSKEWALDYIKEGHGKELEDEVFFIAEDDGKVVGSIAILFWVGKRAEMRDFVVDPAFRGKGMGKQLFEHVLAECEKRHVQKVFAFVLPETAGFFLKRGFEQEGLLKGHAKAGEDVVAIGRML